MRTNTEDQIRIWAQQGRPQQVILSCLFLPEEVLLLRLESYISLYTGGSNILELIMMLINNNLIPWW